MTERSTLFIQNVPPKTTREVLRDIFVIFGDVVNVSVDETKKTALITFEEEADASAALDNMNLSEIYGQTILVTYATKGNLIDKTKAVWDPEQV